ncbi:hypothetical protein G4D37_32580 [Burkholderia pseudomallei]|uniref:hypothetical protein n=1 Tax=Burkholderia pseudomallei TaxID=28450 RepID=UPI001593B285|nr:hypothetical protein [Burkholderia pseudomallei]NVH70829.1 hypothetical protein [Burkholderia pseudomallei]
MIDPAMFLPPDQWLADRMRKMATSLATKSVDKPVSTPAAHGRARAAMGAGAEALDDSCAAAALPLCERGGKNVAGSMGCAADVWDVHKLDHKKCEQALRRSGGRRRGIGERRPIERAPCRDAGHRSASATVYPTYSTKA